MYGNKSESSSVCEGQRQIGKGHNQIFWGDGNILNLVLDDELHRCKNSLFGTLNIYAGKLRLTSIKTYVCTFLVSPSSSIYKRENRVSGRIGKIVWLSTYRTYIRIQLFLFPALYFFFNSSYIIRNLSFAVYLYNFQKNTPNRQ